MTEWGIVEENDGEHGVGSQADRGENCQYIRKNTCDRGFSCVIFAASFGGDFPRIVRLINLKIERSQESEIRSQESGVRSQEDVKSEN